MINLATAPRDKRLRVLGVGPTGRGKTCAFGSWPGRTLVFDFDNRYKPLLDWYPDRLKDFDVQLVTVSNFWEEFHKKVNDLGNYCPYQNIILDSLTSATTTVVTMQMMMKGALGYKDPKLGKELGWKITQGGIPVPSWDEFNGEAMVFATLLDGIKKLDCNFFLTAHPVRRSSIGKGKLPVDNLSGQASIEKENSATYYSLTTFGPKVESIIPTYFDEVWYFSYGNTNVVDGRTTVERFVNTCPGFEYQEAKTAIKGLPSRLDITNPKGEAGKNLYDKVKPFIDVAA